MATKESCMARRGMVGRGSLTGRALAEVLLWLLMEPLMEPHMPRDTEGASVLEGWAAEEAAERGGTREVPEGGR